MKKLYFLIFTILFTICSIGQSCPNVGDVIITEITPNPSQVTYPNEDYSL